MNVTNQAAATLSTPGPVTVCPCLRTPSLSRQARLRDQLLTRPTLHGRLSCLILKTSVAISTDLVHPTLQSSYRRFSGELRASITKNKCTCTHTLTHTHTQSHSQARSASNPYFASNFKGNLKESNLKNG